MHSTPASQACSSIFPYLAGSGPLIGVPCNFAGLAADRMASRSTCEHGYLSRALLLNAVCFMVVRGLQHGQHGCLHALSTRDMVPPLPTQAIARLLTTQSGYAGSRRPAAASSTWTASTKLPRMISITLYLSRSCSGYFILYSAGRRLQFEQYGQADSGPTNECSDSL